MNLSIGIILKFASSQWRFLQNITIKDPEYIFKVPDSPVLIRVKKSRFYSPILPNITYFRRKISSARRSGTSDLEIDWLENVDIQSNSSYAGLNYTDMPRNNSGAENNKDWSLLGLEGWEGEIASPLEYIRQTRSRKRFVADETKAIALATNVSNADIFVARANNPFGHSTKLELRNSTIDDLEMEDIRKSKRNIYNLYSMLKCSTGCSPFIYKGYGCFCGFMGRGVAVDGIDHCCKMHDKCYGSSNCIHYTEYFIPYIWKCYKGKPLCAYSHGDFGGPDSCAATLCNCDFQLAMCLRKFKCPEKRAICSNSSIRILQNLIMNIL